MDAIINDVAKMKPLTYDEQMTEMRIKNEEYEKMHGISDCKELTSKFEELIKNVHKFKLSSSNVNVPKFEDNISNCKKLHHYIKLFTDKGFKTNYDIELYDSVNGKGHNNINILIMPHINQIFFKHTKMY